LLLGQDSIARLERLDRDEAPLAADGSASEEAGGFVNGSRPLDVRMFVRRIITRLAGEGIPRWLRIRILVVLLPPVPPGWGLVWQLLTRELQERVERPPVLSVDSAILHREERLHVLCVDGTRQSFSGDRFAR